MSIANTKKNYFCEKSTTNAKPEGHKVPPSQEIPALSMSKPWPD
jgi:hypothetical protein